MLLYHYCSNLAFTSILKTRRLWFSELSLSNDPMEGRWISHVLESCCTDRGTSDQQTKQLLKHLSVMSELFSATGFCMSEKADLLSQWRAYAEDGGGISIGFEADYFKKLHEHQKLRGDKLNVKLEKVEYDEDAQKEMLNEPLEIILAEVSSRTLDEPILLSNRAVNPRYTPIIQQFLRYRPHLFKLKNPAFEDEHEWRALFLQIIPADTDKDVQPSLSFRAANDRVIPYFETSLEKLSVQSISEVVLGPRNITPTPVIERMLRALGWENVTVRRSTATYR